MSQENVEIVAAAYEAFARREEARAFSFYAEDIEWDLSRGMVEGVGSLYRGHAGVRQCFRDLLASFSVIDFDVKEIIEVGDHVVSTVHERYLGRTSAIEVDRWHYAVWTLRDGKVTRMCVYFDPTEARHAAGLTE